jgi:glycosyltransferase involved in cell wall biosynthesis
MKVTFVIGSLSSGGAERVLVLLADAFLKKGFHVSVVTLNGGESDFYTLSPGVHRVALGISSGVQTFFGFLKLRRALLSMQPDVIVSFIDRMNMLTLSATLGSDIPVVVSERIDPKAHRIGWFWTALRWQTYSRARRIVVQTRGALNYFLPKFQTTACVIPNPVVPPPPDQGPPERLPPKPFLIAMGRFSEQKRFDLLLHAFAGLCRDYPDWKLVIIGDGPLRRKWEALRDALGLADRVLLPGRVKNPSFWLKQADLFVLSSYFEGFPNALCEAMACGLPVISTDCPSGPRDIIREGLDGVLVPNQDMAALSKAMARLMSDREERRRLGSRAVEVIDRFDAGKVATLWEEMLAQVLKEKGSVLG